MALVYVYVGKQKGAGECTRCRALPDAPLRPSSPTPGSDMLCSAGAVLCTTCTCWQPHPSQLRKHQDPDLVTARRRLHVCWHRIAARRAGCAWWRLPAFFIFSTAASPARPCAAAGVSVVLLLTDGRCVLATGQRNLSTMKHSSRPSTSPYTKGWFHGVYGARVRATGTRARR